MAMNFVVFAIRDSASDSYMVPFFMRSVGEAIRAFSDEVQSGKDTPIARHPEDYELFELGEFNDQSGRFEILELPRSAARGKDFVKS